MKSYSEIDVFRKEELAVFTRAQYIVDRLPDRDSSNQLLRCHEVARVVAKILELEVVDGRYETGCEHSWCVVTKPVGKFRWWSILDPYVVGRLPPVQLVAIVPTMPLRYHPGDPRDDIREDVIVELLQHLRT